MKIKNTKSLLALALLGVWGLVGFQLYNKFGPKEESLILTQKVAEPTASTSPQSFQLLANYRDPFLDERLPNPQVVTPQKMDRVNVSARNRVIEKPPLAFPKVIYKGNMKLEDGRSIALLGIDGKSVHLSPNESYQDLKLIEIREEAVRLQFEGQEQEVVKWQFSK